MSISTLTVPYYRATIDGTNVNYMERSEKEGGCSALIRLTDRAKGVGDSLGLISKGGRLFSLAFPESSGWSNHVSYLAGHARTAMALPYLISVVNRCGESFKDGKIFVGTRNALEICSTGNFATSLLVMDKGAASFFGGLGGVFKAFVDGIDLGTTVNKFLEINNLWSKVSDDVEVGPELKEKLKEGIRSDWKATLLKVGRYALALFVGILSILTFVFKVAVAKELLIVGVVASIGSLIFSIASELTTESSRVVKVPERLLKLHDIEQLRV